MIPRARTSPVKSFFPALILSAALAVLLLGVLSSPARAAGGSTSLQFLENGADARGNAMARAGVAAVDDRSLGTLNPAGLALATGQTWAMGYDKVFDDAGQGSLQAALPLAGAGTLGLGFRRFDYGSITKAGDLGESRGQVDAFDQVLQLGWAPRWERWTPGISVKFFQETLDDVTVSGQALDAGLLYRPLHKIGPASFWRRQWSRTTVGAALRNVGPSVTFDRESAALPMTMAFGVSHQSLADALTLSLDLEKPKGGDAVFALGAEYWMKNLLALRAGLRSDQDAGPGLSLGVGFNFGEARFDYSFSALGDLSDAHRATLSFKFGRSLLDVYYEQGVDQMRKGHYADAVLLFDKALRINRDDRRVLKKAYEAAQKMEELEK
jgi:hypothetical protein